MMALARIGDFMLRNLSIAVVLVFVPMTSFAAKDEIIVGVQGGVFFPAAESKSDTAFALATWTAGVYGQYGILDDLYCNLGFSMSTFDGKISGYKLVYDSLDYVGSLDTSVQVYSIEARAIYQLFGGFDIAPYVEAGFGFAWSSYTNNSLLNDDGQDFGLNIGDFGNGSLTLHVGVSANYRIANQIFAGLGLYFTWMISSDLYDYWFSLPVMVSYYF